jgi:hypothetical protein
MKNIHVLPTEKPSRLVLSNNNILTVIKESNYNFSHIKSVHIYITSDEEIKEGDWVIANGGIRFVASINNYKSKTFTDDGTISKQAPSSYCHLKHYKKIILTTDQDLIKDGVQAIDDDFLEWFVKNPSCEEVGLEREHDDTVPYLKMRYVKPYKIIIPQEEPNPFELPKALPDDVFFKSLEEHKQDYSGVHLRHCYQGEYEDGCKYGEDDCPAKPLEPKQETPKEKAKIAVDEIIIALNFHQWQNTKQIDYYIEVRQEIENL